jgi:hypothetical protein
MFTEYGQYLSTAYLPRMEAADFQSGTISLNIVFKKLLQSIYIYVTSFSEQYRLPSNSR